VYVCCARQVWVRCRICAAVCLSVHACVHVSNSVYECLRKYAVVITIGPVARAIVTISNYYQAR